MPRQVTTTVQCQNAMLAPAQDIQHVSLSQDVFGHHRADVHVPFNHVEGSAAAFFTDAPARLLGQPLTLAVEAADPTLFTRGEQLLFKGVVTHLDAGLDNDFAGSVRVGGHSPCQLLASGRQRRTFRNQTLAAIFQQVLAPVPANVLARELRPVHRAPLPYVVQYDETHYDFLRRLAAECGEWLYYDGRALRLGPLPADEGLELWADGYYTTFRYGLTLQPVQERLYAYNHLRHEHFQSATARQPAPGLPGDPFLHAALGAAERLYAEAHRPAGRFVPGPGALDEQARVARAAAVAGLVAVEGASDNPDVQVGRLLRLRGKGIGSACLAPESFGAYRVVAVTHTVDRTGNYANRFTAVPAHALVPPRAAAPPAPAAHPELADVVDDRDPQQLGRVRVRYHWPAARPHDAETDWLRVLTPYSGDGKGQMFNPEIGSQVLVAYHDGLAELPYVLGNLFHAGNPQSASYSRPRNHVKGLQTKAGNKITMNDAAGALSMLLSNSNNKGTALELGYDGAGNVTIQTRGPVHVSGSSITLDAGMLGEIHLHARRISMRAEQEIVAQSVAQDITLIAKERLAYQGKLITGKAEENMHLDGGQQLTSSSDDSRYL